MKILVRLLWESSDYTFCWSWSSIFYQGDYIRWTVQTMKFSFVKQKISIKNVFRKFLILRFFIGEDWFKKTSLFKMFNGLKEVLVENFQGYFVENTFPEKKKCWSKIFSSTIFLSTIFSSTVFDGKIFLAKISIKHFWPTIFNVAFFHWWKSIEKSYYS